MELMFTPPLSSPAKAEDPVIAGAAEYWIPAFAGMTLQGVHQNDSI
jgi:hypothetical protein